MRTWIALAGLVISVAPAMAATPDYGQASSWVCRPGQEGPCTTGLDAMTITADGTRSPQAFAPATDAPIDCFYVYPTVSEATSDYSTMALSPEVAKVAQGQAGRLTARCRMWAPIYRQLTMNGLKHQLSGGGRPDWSGPYADVLAAWQYYIAHENHGRGVVLVSHSQGTILLQRLIAEAIDAAPTRSLIVSAFLAGDPGLAVPKGAVVGGTFKNIPLCTARAQTGCAYVWGGYMADDTASPRFFGENPAEGGVAACDSPAAPGGGAAPLDVYMRRPAAALAEDPPWIHLVGQLAGQCMADGEGNVLRISVQSGRYSARLLAALKSHRPGWGMHPLDINMVQGNMLDVIAAESAAWMQAHPH